MKKVLNFSDFLFEGEKIYQSAGDPYSYKVVDGVWFTKGPRIPSWKSLSNNTAATTKLDKAYPGVRTSKGTGLQSKSGSQVSAQASQGASKIKETSPFTNPKASLLFDGLKLHWMVDGKKIQSWDAISGLTIFNSSPSEWGEMIKRYTNTPEEFAKSKDAGPLPPGNYTVGMLETRKGDHKEVSALSTIWDKITGEFENISTKEKQFQADTEFSRIGWGNFRAPIYPNKGTVTYGRGGFYVHGGSLPGSHGCIDLTDEMDDFSKKYGMWLAATKKGGIPLVSDYQDYSIKRLPGGELLNDLIKNLWVSNQNTDLPGDLDKIKDPLATDPYANIA
jgi:hypothetical protein